MSKKVIIIGYSGHAYVAADILLAAQFSLAGYCENEIKTTNPFALDFKQSEKIFFSNPENISNYSAFIGIGDSFIREIIFNNLNKNGVNIINAIHPKAVIGFNVKFGKGVFVAANATINPCCTIGDGAICNTSCTLDHECIIGDFSHIAPGTVLCGNVTIGKNSFIGANSTVVPGKKINDRIIVGAGSVVTSDLVEPGVYVGAPARLIKKL